MGNGPGLLSITATDSRKENMTEGGWESERKYQNQNKLSIWIMDIRKMRKNRKNKFGTVEILGFLVAFFIGKKPIVAKSDQNKIKLPDFKMSSEFLVVKIINSQMMQLL